MTLDQYIHHLDRHYHRSADFQENWNQLLESLDPEMIAQNLGLVFTKEGNEINLCYVNSHNLRHEFRQSFFSSDISDYIYAVINSPSYKTEYQDSEENHLPKIPYPTNVGTFWQLVKLGAAIREFHALQDLAAQQCAEMDKIIAEIKQTNEG